MDRASALALERLVRERGVTRLCHLTPVRNLVHVATGDGLRSLTALADEQGDYNQQDLRRIDNHPDHISCSVEYPNGWYLRRRQSDVTTLQTVFPDWVCLALDLDILWRDGTRVCVRNAAAGGGLFVRDVSAETFAELYATAVEGHGGLRRRPSAKLVAAPTDDQAEVLVRRSVPLDKIQSVIVRTKSDARNLHAALAQIGAPVERLRWIIAPLLLTATELSNAVAAGQRPPEEPWEPEGG